MNTTNRIRILRKEMGLTQPELAAQTGISVHSINSYESGRRQPNSKAMAELERFFSVSGAYLRGETDERHPAKREDESAAAETGSGYGQLFRQIDANLQTLSPPMRESFLKIFLELKNDLAATDPILQKATVDLLGVAVTRCSSFVRDCAEGQLSPDQVFIDNSRAHTMMEISDALLAAQSKISSRPHPEL